MQLSEFPGAIAQTEIALLEQKQHLHDCQSELDILTNKIDSEVAFDPDLKNDNQRKVRRFDLMQSEEYLKSAVALRNSQTSATRIEIYARSLSNQFSVAKLEARQAVAQLESKP